MMIELLQARLAESFSATTGGANGPVVLTSTGDKFIFTPKAPIRVLKWGLVVNDTAIVTGGTNLVMTLEKRVTAGSDVGRTVLDTITITDPNSAYALGKGFYREPFVASSKSTTPAYQPTGFGPIGVNAPDIESGQSQITISVGQELVVKVGTAVTTSGKGQVFIEYVLLPISRPSSYGTTDAGTVSLTENYTKL